MSLLISSLVEARPESIDALDLNLAIEQDGVYRVGFEQIDVNAGVDQSPVPSKSLSLRNNNQLVAIRIDDGGDGQFGPGDHIYFVGQHLSGAQSYLNEFTRYNVYQLSTNKGEGLRMQSIDYDSPELTASQTDPENLPSQPRINRHLERNMIRIALQRNKIEEPQGDPDNAERVESWYWKKLSHLDSQPFRIDLALGAGDHTEEGPVVRVGMRGLSRDKHADLSVQTHHTAELVLNGQVIASAEWNGVSAVVLESDVIDPSVLNGETDRLEIRIPERTPPGSTVPLIDVSLLNWIEVSQKYDAHLVTGQSALDVTAGGAAIPVKKESGIEFYSPSGGWFSVSAQPMTQTLSLRESGTWYRVPDEAYLVPAWVTPSRENNLRSHDNQADYLMIAHVSLLEAIEPLAEHHRLSGLNVSVIDVADIYNEFGGGLETPLAIRSFIRHALAEWQSPSPRFVLLVGDASWDVFNDEVDDETFAASALKPGVRQRSPRSAASLELEQIARRNLVPTFQVQTNLEFAASDNSLVTLADGDWQPGMAVGRIPVASPDELSVVLDKLLAHSTSARSGANSIISRRGAWQGRVAVVADASPDFQKRSNELVKDLESSGFRANRIYPDLIYPDNKDLDSGPGPAENQISLIDAFDAGQLIVHFLGHGGRFVWRTGPIDLRQGRDMFSVQDLPRMSPNHRLPLVMSMTCSSGPFDHPSANSMAEIMLGIPERGAVAVLAASWRVPATIDFSRNIVSAITKDQATIGEAIFEAKKIESKRLLVESYNLFGDPAMKLEVPKLNIALQMEIRDGVAVVSSEDDLTELSGGNLTVDWLNAEGDSLKTDQQLLQGRSLELHYAWPEGTLSPAAVSIYIWHEVTGVDGFGLARLDFSDLSQETVKVQK